MVARQRTQSDTPKRIVDAARTAFANTGFDRTATAAIAAAAGCSEATLFKYFGSKRALLVAVLRDAAGSVFEGLDAAGAEAEGDVEVFAARATTILESPLFGEMARLRSFALTRIDEPEVRSAVIDSVSGFDARLTSLLQAGQRAGTVRRDVPAGHLTELVFGLTLAAGFRYALYGEDAASRLPSVVSSLLTLLGPPSRRRQKGSA